MRMSKTKVLTGKKKKSTGWKSYIPFYLMALPGLIYFFINNYMPMGGLIVAFKSYSAKKGIWGSDWARFNNFRYLFMTNEAFNITRNTLLYNVAFIICGTFLAVTVAILLNEIRSKKASRLYQSVYLLPHLVSWVIISYLAYAFLSADTGFINNTILKLFGGKVINWYNSPKYWPVIIVIVYLWQSVGYTTIVYFASVVGFDRGYYEAAELEGAGTWKKIKYITLPLLKPTIITMVLLAVGKIFYSDFGLFYQVPMNAGALYPTTNVIDTFVYRGLMQQNNIGMSAAAGLYQSVVGFIIVIAANLLVRKIDKDSSFI